MALRERTIFKVFVAVLSVWSASLLTIYLPISKLVATTFPLTINGYTLTFFIVSTCLAFGISLYVGLDELSSKT